jgi:malonyl-CoA decarboxylase
VTRRAETTPRRTSQNGTASRTVDRPGVEDNQKSPVSAADRDGTWVAPGPRVIASDPSSTVRANSTSRVDYRIGGPDGSTPSNHDSGGSVREALGQCHDLLCESSEAQGNRLATYILAAYEAFDEAARAQFFDGLVDLHRVGERRRRELFLRLNRAAGAIAWLVRMREHLQHRKKWAGVERDLMHVLRMLFDPAGLDFQQIDADTPSRVLKRLIEAEAVHPVDDWREMGRRLEADRRCYAFYHPAWPREPLIFTEVALTRGITSEIRPILDPDSALADPRTCDTAIFYSISNCQPGLRGFSFGNLLLGRAIERLQAETPWLRRFATISPIPGFRSWLCGSAAGLLDATRGLGTWLSNDQSSLLNGTIPGEFQDELLVLCAHYLLRVKEGREPADPVARFHLGNGARLHRINSSSDLSRAGMSRSLGLTVNYVYDPNELERNAEAYRRSYEVRASAEVLRRARLAAPLMSNRSLVA